MNCRKAAGWHYFLVCVFLFPWRHASERKAGRKKIFVGALSRNLVLCHFSCRFHDTEPGSIHKNPGRFPCIISLRIRWHVRRHDTGRQKVNLVELKSVAWSQCNVNRFECKKALHVLEKNPRYFFQKQRFA